ncbi:hypothetical protein AB0M36_22100 [Actinoplanes sp. NPDC051346]|uniref:hypothetical protein n=1 Tax=Actinoplanes sp. NPDC051346 TaxID=3155048 RepID=UPI0034421AC2
MDELQAEGLTNHILYGIDQDENLKDPDLLDRYVTFMINQRYFSRPIEEYEQAVAATLGKGALSARSLGFSQRYGEAELLGFLADLFQRMQDRKPWPRPPFRKIPASRWDDVALDEVVARVRLSQMQLQGYLKRFDRVPLGDGKVPVILLELRTGERVAVIGSADPRESFTVLRRRQDDQRQVLQHFLECTEIPADAVEPLG